MIHVYLDDARPCPRGFVAARNVQECILLLQECEVDILSLDYDLGPTDETGFDVVSWMVANQHYPKRIYLHTSSDLGRSQMYHQLYVHKPEEVLLENGPMPYSLLQYIAKQ